MNVRTILAAAAVAIGAASPALAKYDHTAKHGSTKVTLLNGSEKADVDLTSVGDKFEAKGSYKVANGTKGIASVTLPGKPAAVARFEVK